MALLIFYKNLEPSSARPQSWGAAAAAEKNRKRYSSMKFWRIRPFSKREGKLIKKMKARVLFFIPQLGPSRLWPQIFHLYFILPLLRPRKRARQTFYTERRSNLKENLADSIGDNIIMQIMDSAWPVVKRNDKNIHHIDDFRLVKPTLAIP